MLTKLLWIVIQALGNLFPNFGQNTNDQGGSTNLIMAKPNNSQNFWSLENPEISLIFSSHFSIIFDAEITHSRVPDTDAHPRFDQMGPNFVEKILEVKGAFPQSFTPFR